MAENNQLTFDFNTPLESLPQLWTPDDIYDSADQAVIERFGEDSRVERKRAEVSQKDLADYLSMWANTQPSGGIVFIGVGNNGELLGCKNTAANHLNELETARRLCPDAKHEFKRIKIVNTRGEEDFIVLLRVYYRDDKLVETASGEAFVREGDEKRRLTETEKREVRLNKGELDVESERVPLRFPHDFDADLLSAFKDQYIAKRRLPSRYSLVDILVLSKMGKFSDRGFEPNLACALLFAKDPRSVAPGAYIRVLRYEGTEEQFGTKMNTIYDEVFDGPLPLQISDAETQIAAQIRKFTRLGTDGRFATRPEYPTEVWLEAIVNAVSHRSYNLKNMNIYVKMFEDKMVIESPGAFMPPTTAESVYDAHNPRNPNLMWALYYFDYVQCAFEGTRRMRQGMRDANLPDPQFVQAQAGTFKVTVTLKNDLEHRKEFVRVEASTSIPREVFEGLSEPEKMIVNYLADKSRLNVVEASLLINKQWRDTKAILDALEEKGVVGRLEGKARSRGRHYFLIKR